MSPQAGTQNRLAFPKLLAGTDELQKPLPRLASLGMVLLPHHRSRASRKPMAHNKSTVNPRNHKWEGQDLYSCILCGAGVGIKEWVGGGRPRKDGKSTRGWCAVCRAKEAAERNRTNARARARKKRKNGTDWQRIDRLARRLGVAWSEAAGLRCHVCSSFNYLNFDAARKMAFCSPCLRAANIVRAHAEAGQLRQVLELAGLSKFAEHAFTGSPAAVVK